MKEKGVPAIKVAEDLGISRGSFSSFLSGRIGIQFSNLEKLFEYLDIRLQ